MKTIELANKTISTKLPAFVMGILNITPDSFWQASCGDVVSAMAPFSPAFAGEMIKKLRGYKIIQGLRGEEGVNEAIFAEMVSRVATLCHYAPEIIEMDINPLLGNSVNLTAVDARIRIKRND